MARGSPDPPRIRNYADCWGKATPWGLRAQLYMGWGPGLGNSQEEHAVRTICEIGSGAGGGVARE